MTRHRVRGWVGVCFALGVTASSCGGEAPAAPPAQPPPGVSGALEMASFAGRLADNNTFIGVVTGGDAIRAYVCDGATGTWFDGTALRLPTLLTNADGAQLFLQATAGGLAGSVRLASGREISFTAPRTAQSSLFRAEVNAGGDRFLGGWIVLPDGQQRGSVLADARSFESSVRDGMVQTAGLEQEIAALLFPQRFEPAALRERTPNQLSFTIGGLGDSYASGEGAPEVNGNHGVNGLINPGSQETEEVWDQRAANRSRAPGYTPPALAERIDGVPDAVPLPSEERLARACHRSGRNGTRVAGDLLAEEWPAANVVAESVACSGAQILNLTSARYAGPDGPDQLQGSRNRPQIEQLMVLSALRRRPIDAVTMSIGGNDLNFVPIIQACLVDPDCSDDDAAPFSGGTPTNLFARGRSGAAGSDFPLPIVTKFATLAAALDRVVPRSRVLLLDVPNMLRRPDPAAPQTSSALCPGVDMLGLDVALPLLGVDAAEVRFLDQNIISDFRQVLADAATANRWTLVSGHVNPSRLHGLCAPDPWFGTLGSGYRRQGADVSDGHPFVNLLVTAANAFPPFDSNPLPMRLSGGIGHPNARMHTEGYGPAIADALRPLLRAKVRPLAPRNLRLAAQALNGTVTVRWDDRATTETEFRVRVRPSGATTWPAPTRLMGENLPTEHSFSATGSTAREVQVQACHVGRSTSFEECSDFVPTTPLRVTSFAPSETPTGIVVRNESCVATNRCFPARMVWARVPNGNGAHLFYRVVADGRTYETQDNFLEIGAVSSFTVRSCNFLGCGAPSSPRVGPTRGGAFLTESQRVTRCQQIATTTRVPGEPTLDPAGICQ